jgi:hypothetical protein
MDVPSVKGVLMQHAVEHLRSELASGRLSREQLTLRLEQEDLALFEKDAIVAGLWYPSACYERMLDLIYEQGGRRSEALVDFGRRCAEHLLASSAFTAMFDTIARRSGHESVAPLLLRLSEVVINFTRWKYLGPRIDDFAVEVSEAADYHEHARHTVQGMIEAFGSRLFGRQLEVTSERPSRDRILFRSKLRS